MARRRVIFRVSRRLLDRFGGVPEPGSRPVWLHPNVSIVGVSESQFGTPDVALKCESELFPEVAEGAVIPTVLFPLAEDVAAIAAGA